MRNTGSTHGSGGERGASALYHPDTSRADHELGFIARITPRRGARSVVLAEKTSRGWARRTGRRAFTRVELCACLAAGALLILLALPALATTQSRGHVAQCLNNLRLMGRAVQMWASDFEGQAPWRTPVQSGGLLSVGPRPGITWFDLAFLSNQLVTPRILACPADAGAIAAPDFNSFISPAYRNNSVSYLVNLESFAEEPQGFLFGDRNVQLTLGPFGCSAMVNNTVGFDLFAPANLGWTNLVHRFTGNIVRMDGSVSETSNDQLRAAMARSRNDNGQYVHLHRPR